MPENNYIRVNAPNRNQKPFQLERSHLKQTLELKSGLLCITLTARRPIHVGTGNLLPLALLNPQPHNPRSYPLVAPFMREDNRYIIPGSSLKGSFRSLFEVMTYSCMSTVGPRAHPHPGHGLVRCEANRRKFEKSSFCPACHVFGGLGYMGHVFFDQAELVEPVTGEVFEAPQPWSPQVRDEHKSMRKVYTSGPSQYDAIEPIECLPIDTQLRFDLHYRNLTDVELGLLLLALGQGPDRFYPKVGARKAHDFGDVEVVVAEAWGITKETLLHYNQGYEDLSGKLATYIQAALEDQHLFYEAGYRALVHAIGGT